MKSETRTPTARPGSGTVSPLCSARWSRAWGTAQVRSRPASPGTGRVTASSLVRMSWDQFVVAPV